MGLKNSTDTQPRLPAWQDVKVEISDGIAWVALNRPEKRNAMNPALNADMISVLDYLEEDERCQVLVLRARPQGLNKFADKLRARSV